MGVTMCPFLIWPSHFLDASYVPGHKWIILLIINTTHILRQFREPQTTFLEFDGIFDSVIDIKIS